MEERGRSFSGGQRQRITLVRSLLARAPVLVLVEPTSAVDAHTETRIAERLVAARAGSTTVLVTVSPLMLDHADVVALVVDGRVVVEGTHRELLRRAGLPRRRRTRGGLMSTHLPVADTAQMRGYARALLVRHRRALLGALVLHALAAVCGLAGPFLLGSLVQAVRDGTTAAYVDRIAAFLLAALLVQVLLTRRAHLASLVLGERVLAELRLDFLRNVVSLPLGTVERAGTGDLLTRTTSDVDTLAVTVRFAVPEILVAFVTTLLTLTAAVLVAPILAVVALVAVPLLWVSTRWYLERAPGRATCASASPTAR